MVHQAVLQQEAIAALAIAPAGAYIDGTFGRGGHSRAILAHLGSAGRLIAIDRDPEAIRYGEMLQGEDSRFEIIQANFSEVGTLVESRGLQHRIDGILFDLGVSSPQLDTADRGFSFRHDGPLDMRMNPQQGISAAEWLQRAKESEIADVLYDYGEERHSRRIARSIVRERTLLPIDTTARLAAIVAAAHPSWERDKHPATRSFQAIRIHINNELAELDDGLEQAMKILKHGGRMVVISFHSLEDRRVKRFMARQAKGDSYPRDLPVTAEMLNPQLRVVGKAVKPATEEVAANIRARSAVLRVAERISVQGR